MSGVRSTRSATAAGLEWEDGMLLGHAEMDAVHEEFVGLLRALHAAPDERLSVALHAVARHVERHFAMEDACMRATDFPPRDCHIDEHAAVLASIRGVQRRLVRGDFEVARRLAHELQAWFPGHAQHLDSALAQWLCKHRLGGAPVVVQRRLRSERATL
jgi:hemerythrin